MKNIYLSILISLLTIAANAQNALKFDGNNDKVDCGNDASLQISGTTITLEAWIYPTAWRSAVHEGSIINKENNGPDHGYMLRCGDNGKLNFNLGVNGWNEITTTTDALTLNTWQHVAGTYDGTTMKLYINAVLVGSKTVTLTMVNALQNLTIGNWSNGTDRGFIGKIDEVRIWNTTKALGEIANYMYTSACNNAAGLVAYYKLNEGSAGSDNSGTT